MIIYKNKNIVIPIGLGPNFNDDTVEIKNENKSVTITENGTEIVTYDPAEYTGLGVVHINTDVITSDIQPSAIVEYTENGEYDIFPDPEYDGIREIEVTVNVQPELEAKTVDSSTASQVVTTNKYGLSSVTVNPYVLDEKTVDSSTVAQVVTSDEDGLRQVTINPMVLSPLEVDSSTANQEYTGNYNSVKVNKYTLDSKTVDSSTVSQLVVSDEDGLSSVTVNPYVLDSSSLTVTENGEYAVTSSADGLSRVDVSVNIDTQAYYDSGYEAGETAGVAEQKAKLDSSVFTTNGTFTREDGWNEVTVDVNLIRNQNKTTDSSTKSQTITADAGYTGLGVVIVNPYILDSKTVDPSTNSQTVTSDENGLSSVTVNPYTLEQKAREPIYDIVSQDASAGNVDITTSAGYNGMSKVRVGKTAIINRKAFDSSTVSQTFNTINQSTYAKGVNEIVINPYVLDSSSATFTQNGEYVFTSAVDGLSRVDVSVNIDTQGYYDSGYSAGESVGIAEGIAAQKALLDSSTFTLNGTYTRENGWNQVTVNVDTVNNQNKTVDSSTTSQTVTPDNGYTGLGRVVVNPYTLTTKTVNPSTTSQNVVPGTGYNGLSNVTVNAVTSSIDANITAGNIKKDVTILGVTGTYEGGGTVTPGRPYIQADGTYGSQINLEISVPTNGYYEDDVYIDCTFSAGTGTSYSAFSATSPMSTTKCIVGIGGYYNRQIAYGLGVGRQTAGTGAEQLYYLFGQPSTSTSYYNVGLTTGNDRVWHTNFLMNDSDDNEAQIQICTGVVNRYSGHSVAFSNNWFSCGSVQNNEGDWSVFCWEDNDDTYSPAPSGTRIYELHIRALGVIYDFYPVYVDGKAGLAKYTNGVFTTNLFGYTPSALTYGVQV